MLALVQRPILPFLSGCGWKRAGSRKSSRQSGQTSKAGWCGTSGERLHDAYRRSCQTRV